MNKNTTLKFITFLLFCGLLASSAFFSFPDIKEAGIAPIVAVAFASSLTQLTAAWNFLTSLRTFRQELRLAYYLLTAGIFFFSFTQLVPSLSVFTDFLGKSQLLTNIALVAPYALGALLMFLGMRTFARLLKVETQWASLLMVLPVSLVVGVLFGFLALSKALPEDDKLLVFVSFGFVAWCGVLSVGAMMVATKIRHAISDTYRVAMNWIIVALAMLSFTAFHEAIVKTYFAESSYASNSFSLWPFLLVGILFLGAGVTFKATGRRSLRLPDNASFIDIVTAVAELASKPAVIDPELDKVRAITSLRGDKDLTPADKTTLVEVYKHLEQYLTTEEPLQAYNKEELRGNLPNDFLKSLGS